MLRCASAHVRVRPPEPAAPACLPAPAGRPPSAPWATWLCCRALRASPIWVSLAGGFGRFSGWRTGGNSLNVLATFSALQDPAFPLHRPPQSTRPSRGRGPSLPGRASWPRWPSATAEAARCAARRQERSQPAARLRLLASDSGVCCTSLFLLLPLPALLLPLSRSSSSFRAPNSLLALFIQHGIAHGSECATLTVRHS